jgi:hypothetical protein
VATGANVIQFPAQVATTSSQPFEGKELSELRRQFQNAVSTKVNENTESAEAERYFNAVQWTNEELKVLKDRNQPAVTFNRFKRKINTVVGILEKVRQDPKAYPRNPNQPSEDGAELATNTLRYALGWDWLDKSSQSARKAAIRGISGVELVLTEGDQGDPEIELDEVDQRDFFYDPRSGKHDFSDARFMGTSRWVDVDEAQSMWPDYADHINDYVERGYASDWERGDDRNKLAWLNKPERQVRIVDHWYMRGRDWFYAIYCGEVMLEEGPSPHRDHKGRSQSKYIMWSCEVDQDNDRYGFFRDLKGPQDEINHRRSKALHALNSRQVVAEEGAVDDVEKSRKELARSDGWVVVHGERRFEMLDQAKQQIVQGNLDMLAEAKAEIDTYGPNPGLIGTEVDASSGRAIQLLQSAGIAELGTFMLAFKHWKLRVYRAVWSAVQQFWTAERWIRVNDDEQMAQFVQVNGWQIDSRTGMPAAINQLAALDVDIILDEGPDTLNSMADTFDTLMMMGKQGAGIPPAIIIELSNLPGSVKKRVMALLEQQNQPNPMEQPAMQLRLAQEEAKLEEIRASAALKTAQTQKTMAEAANPDTGQQVDTQADLAKARKDIAQAMEIEQRVAAPPQDTPEPGLFAVNQARAMKDSQAARREAIRADNLVRYGAEEPAKIPPPRPPGGVE